MLAPFAEIEEAGNTPQPVITWDVIAGIALRRGILFELMHTSPT